MTPPRSILERPRFNQAWLNGNLRPAKTSALNPYRIAKTADDSVVMPKVSSLKKAGFTGDLKTLAREASSSGDGASGLRQTAADLTRRYRKTGRLSAVTRLTQLDARLTVATQ